MKYRMESVLLYPLIGVYFLLMAVCAAWWFFWYKVAVALGAEEEVADHLREMGL